MRATMMPADYAQIADGKLLSFETRQAQAGGRG